MGRRLHRWGILLLVLTLVSGQTAGLQLVAWTGMLIARTQDQGWAVALRTTFDGNHPCCLCKVVKVLDAADSDATPGPEVPKPDKPGATKTAKPIDLHAPPSATPAAAAVGEPLVWGREAQRLLPQHRPQPEPPPPCRDAAG